MFKNLSMRRIQTLLKYQNHMIQNLWLVKDGMTLTNIYILNSNGDIINSMTDFHFVFIFVVYQHCDASQTELN